MFHLNNVSSKYCLCLKLLGYINVIYTIKSRDNINIQKSFQNKIFFQLLSILNKKKTQPSSNLNNVFNTYNLCLNRRDKQMWSIWSDLVIILIWFVTDKSLVSFFKLFIFFLHSYSSTDDNTYFLKALCHCYIRILFD